MSKQLTGSDARRIANDFRHECLRPGGRNLERMQSLVDSLGLHPITHITFYEWLTLDCDQATRVQLSQAYYALVAWMSGQDVSFSVPEPCANIGALDTEGCCKK